MEGCEVSSKKRKRGKEKPKREVDFFGGSVSGKHSLGNSARNNKKIKLNGVSKGQRGGAGKAGAEDPSVEYLAAPLKAPIVDEAKAFFAEHAPSLTFKVNLGPVAGWRTVAKLSVRAPPLSAKARARARKREKQQQEAAAAGGGKTKKKGNKVGGSVPANWQPPLIGIFARGSHKVLPLLSSSAHHPAINRAAQRVHEACVNTKVSGYDGEHAGGLSYVAFQVARATGRVQLVLVWNAGGPEEVGRHLLKSLIQDLTQQQQQKKKKQKKPAADHPLWHSIWCHYHAASRHDNAIFGREGVWDQVYGSEDSICEQLDIPVWDLVKGEGEGAGTGAEAEAGEGAVATTGGSGVSSTSPRLYFPPNVFRQANLDAFQEIVRRVRQWVPTNCGRAVELYGGVGTIGLHLLGTVRSLSCSDANPFNKACFERSLESVPPSLSAQVSYTSGAAGEMATAGEMRGAELLVVDPPRKGLDEEVLEELQGSGSPARVIYVSCGFPAFQRDFARITGSGNYRVMHAEGFVLFPGANHIEVFAVFDKKS